MILRQPCRYFLKGTCTRSPCECWHPPECQFYKTELVCEQGISVCSRITRLMNKQTKSQRKAIVPQKRRKSDDKNAVACDKCTSIGLCLARFGVPGFSKTHTVPKVLRSIRRVRFTQSTLRQAGIRENKGPSLGKIQVKIPHQRSPYAMKFEDRSQEETQRQQRCAQSKAWNLAQQIYKLKEKEKATFYSPSEEWVLSVASKKESEESLW